MHRSKRRRQPGQPPSSASCPALWSNRSARASGAVAEQLRGARLRMDLSLRDMALHLGISQRALSHYELGTRVPSRSVLLRYLECVPRMEAASLLLAAHVARPARSSAALRAVREAWGFRAREADVLLRVDRDGNETETLDVRGIGLEAVRLDSSVVRVAMMRAACTGSGEAIRRIASASADTRELDLEDGARSHSYRIPTRRGARGFDYRCVTSYAIAADPRASTSATTSMMACHDVQYPIGRLTLTLAIERATRADASPPRLIAWPSVAEMEPQRDVAAILHPRARPKRSRGGWSVAVDEPLPGLRYALVLEPGVERRPPAAGASAGSLGAVLRAARRRHGLSLRDAAARLGGLSHGTIRNVERGGDAAHGTLVAYLRAFPELTPDDLLPRSGGGDTMDDDALWMYFRDALALHAREIVKRVRIEPDGRARVSVRTRDLRDLRAGAPGLQLRHGGLLAAMQASPHVMHGITGAPDALSTRLAYERDGSSHHVLRLPRQGPRGLSFTVRNAPSLRPLFTLAEAHLLDDSGPGPHYEGTSHWVRFACERLRILVTFPRGFRPAGLIGHVCPGCMVPVVEVPALSRRQVASRPMLRSRGGVFTASLTVERPTVGFKHGLAWQLA